VPPPAGSRFSEGQTVTSGGAGAQAAAPGQQQPTTPFYKKRGFIISQLIIIPLGIALLFILLFPVVRAIVQDVVNKSTLDVQVAAITAPANDSYVFPHYIFFPRLFGASRFLLAMQGNVAHTGVIAASISFPDPVNVSWVPDDGGPEVDLGYLKLDTLHAKSKRATINQTATPFIITNQSAFGLFAAHMITDQNFTWRLHSKNLRVQALKFPVSKGPFYFRITHAELTFRVQGSSSTKRSPSTVRSQIISPADPTSYSFTGFQSFNGGVTIQDFQLPSDNPAGGIDFVAVTKLNNPRYFLAIYCSHHLC
jgi:hypothetical protein